MPPQILIVEDDLAMISLYHAILKRLDVTVLSASTVSEAQALLQREIPAIVMLDLGLPGADGGKLVQFIRRSPAHTHTRILVITGYTDLLSGEERKLVDAMITKPVRATALLNILRNLLGN